MNEKQISEWIKYCEFFIKVCTAIFVVIAAIMSVSAFIHVFGQYTKMPQANKGNAVVYAICLILMLTGFIITTMVTVLKISKYRFTAKRILLILCYSVIGALLTIGCLEQLSIDTTFINIFVFLLIGMAFLWGGMAVLYLQKRTIKRRLNEECCHNVNGDNSPLASNNKA